MIDHHQNQMIMLHSLILILLWFNLRNDLHSFLFLEKKEISTKLLEPVFTPEFYRFRFFSFSKTTGTTHRIAELIDLGVENTEIPTLLFDNSSLQ
jgi:phosphoesterase RecJ-like protein